MYPDIPRILSGNESDLKCQMSRDFDCFFLDPCPVRTKFKIPKYSRGIPSSLEFPRTFSASTVDL